MLGNLATSIILFSCAVYSARNGQPWIRRSFKPRNSLNFSISAQLLSLVVEMFKLCSEAGIFRISSASGRQSTGHSATLRSSRLEQLEIKFTNTEHKSVMGLHER